MNIITSAKRSGILASVLIIGVIGTGSAITISNMMNDDKPSNNTLTKKANVMNEEIVNKPIESPDATVVAEPTIEAPKEPNVQQSTPVKPEEPKNSNPYAAGSNVWYVYDKRSAAGKAVGVWGNARLWVQSARSAGVLVDNTPEVGAAYSAGDQLYFVESISENSVTLSTYLGSVTTREMSKDEYSIGWFIH